MESTQSQTRTLEAPWRFIGAFGLYIFLCLMALRLAPFSLIEKFVLETTATLAAFLRLLALPVTSDGPMLSFFNFPMEITLECTAIYQLIIALSGIWAYPAHSVQYKAVGTLVLTTGILLLNVFRIGILGAIGYYANQIFDFMHIYLWQSLFALLTLLLWVLWVRGGRVLSRALLRYVGGGLVAASLSTVALLQILPAYAALLAGAATVVSPLLSWLLPLPSNFTSHGNYVVFHYPDGGIFSFVLSVYVMNTAIFATLIVVTANLADKLAHAKRLITGLTILFVLHLGFVFEYGYLLSHVDPNASFNSFFWFDRGLSFVSPLLVWLMVARLFPASTPDSHQSNHTA